MQQLTCRRHTNKTDQIKVLYFIIIQFFNIKNRLVKCDLRLLRAKVLDAIKFMQTNKYLNGSSKAKFRLIYYEKGSVSDLNVNIRSSLFFINVLLHQKYD